MLEKTKKAGKARKSWDKFSNRKAITIKDWNTKKLQLSEVGLIRLRRGRPNNKKYP